MLLWFSLLGCTQIQELRERSRDAQVLSHLHQRYGETFVVTERQHMTGFLWDSKGWTYTVAMAADPDRVGRVTVGRDGEIYETVGCDWSQTFHRKAMKTALGDMYAVSDHECIDGFDFQSSGIWPPPRRAFHPTVNGAVFSDEVDVPLWMDAHARRAEQAGFARPVLDSLTVYPAAYEPVTELVHALQLPPFAEQVRHGPMHPNEDYTSLGAGAQDELAAWLDEGSEEPMRYHFIARATNAGTDWRHQPSLADTVNAMRPGGLMHLWVVGLVSTDDGEARFEALQRRVELLPAPVRDGVVEVRVATVPTEHEVLGAERLPGPEAWRELWSWRPGSAPTVIQGRHLTHRLTPRDPW